MYIIGNEEKEMKSKDWMFKTLRTILEWYETYRAILDYSKEEAIEKTLETYSDFYEVFLEVKEDA